MTRKEQIIETAIDLFAARSFESVSIQALAEASGVAQGLLYRHFKNKNDLLLHLVMMGMEQVQATLLPYKDETLGFREAFTAHISLSLQYLHTHYKLWKVLHATRQNTSLVHSLDISVNPRKEIIRPIKEKLQQEGVAEPKIHAWYIFTLIDGLTSLYLMYPEEYPLRKMEKLLIDKISYHVR